MATPDKLQGNNRPITHEPGTLFIMKPTKGAEFALKKWLQDKEFNDFNSGWFDKKGNPGIGLTLEQQGQGRLKVAVIICLDDSQPTAERLVNEALGFTHEGD